MRYCQSKMLLFIHTFHSVRHSQFLYSTDGPVGPLKPQPVSLDKGNLDLTNQALNTLKGQVLCLQSQGSQAENSLLEILTKILDDDCCNQDKKVLERLGTITKKLQGLDEVSRENILRAFRIKFDTKKLSSIFSSDIYKSIPVLMPGRVASQLIQIAYSMELRLDIFKAAPIISGTNIFIISENQDQPLPRLEIDKINTAINFIRSSNRYSKYFLDHVDAICLADIEHLGSAYETAPGYIEVQSPYSGGDVDLAVTLIHEAAHNEFNYEHMDKDFAVDKNITLTSNILTDKLLVSHRLSNYLAEIHCRLKQLDFLVELSHDENIDPGEKKNIMLQTVTDLKNLLSQVNKQTKLFNEEGKKLIEKQAKGYEELKFQTMLYFASF